MRFIDITITNQDPNIHKRIEYIKPDSILQACTVESRNGRDGDYTKLVIKDDTVSHVGYRFLETKETMESILSRIDKYIAIKK